MPIRACGAILPHFPLPFTGTQSWWHQHELLLVSGHPVNRYSSIILFLRILFFTGTAPPFCYVKKLFRHFVCNLPPFLSGRYRIRTYKSLRTPPFQGGTLAILPTFQYTNIIQAQYLPLCPSSNNRYRQHPRIFCITPYGKWGIRTPKPNVRVTVFETA